MVYTSFVWEIDIISIYPVHMKNKTRCRKDVLARISYQVWSRKHGDACDTKAYKWSSRRRIPGDTVRRLREYNDDSACSSVVAAESWWEMRVRLMKFNSFLYLFSFPIPFHVSIGTLPFLPSNLQSLTFNTLPCDYLMAVFARTRQDIYSLSHS